MVQIILLNLSEPEDDETKKQMIWHHRLCYNFILITCGILIAMQRSQTAAVYWRDSFALGDWNFRREVRMKKTFPHNFCKISHFPVFLNKSNNKQKAISKQVAVALYRLRLGGNGVCYGYVARHFGIADGSAKLYTRRIMTALLSLKSEDVKWSTTNEGKLLGYRLFLVFPYVPSAAIFLPLPSSSSGDWWIFLLLGPDLKSSSGFIVNWLKLFILETD